MNRSRSLEKWNRRALSCSSGDKRVSKIQPDDAGTSREARQTWTSSLGNSNCWGGGRHRRSGRTVFISQELRVLHLSGSIAAPALLEPGFVRLIYRSPQLLGQLSDVRLFHDAQMMT